MNGWGEESQGGPSQLTAEMVRDLLEEEFHVATPPWFEGFGDEDTLLVQKGPPLNLTFTPTPEHFNKIASAILQENGQKPPYSTENTKNLTPPETPKNTEKTKAMNFQISKITIGEWTHTSVYPDDLKAKFYFAKMRLMWEILDEVSKLKRKIEIHWSDVLSFKATINPQDATGTLEVELGKCPTFFMEINLQAGKHTQWKQSDQDFTLGQSASKYRRHTIHCPPRDLKNNLDKLVSAHSFWSKLAKVKFPTLPQSLYFDDGNRNNNNNSNLSPSGHCRTLGFNGNSDPCHHYPQGLAHVPVDNVNSNMTTQFCANNQMTPSFQDNHQNETMSQLPGMQVTYLPSQHINMERSISWSHFNNPVIQDYRQTRNTGELLGTQAYGQETQPNSVYKIGPYLRGILAEEDAIQKMKCIRQFQTNGKCVCNQCFNNTNGSVPPNW
ncbi:unnamed protein product [Eruca vesicaria subsp. sativa]|uniref:TRF2/HOY1 PH-like domain-containing protein n=1 Tax=Eruca vesicaria subsp. sativa TaxID=29727 RepID=A0ABC8KD77_ERUVS|nr:unnamed protein product [Eruca vesicaria subsp. sativa]